MTHGMGLHLVKYKGAVVSHIVYRWLGSMYKTMSMNNYIVKRIFCGISGNKVGLLSSVCLINHRYINIVIFMVNGDIVWTCICLYSVF